MKGMFAWVRRAGEDLSSMEPDFISNGKVITDYQ